MPAAVRVGGSDCRSELRMAQGRGNGRYISIEHSDVMALVIGEYRRSTRTERENAGGKEYRDGSVEYGKRR